MARLGRKDRGLLSRINSSGEKVWYVRLWHEGRDKRFGSFPTKTKAREFYEKSKLEQKEGRFFPERFHHGGQVLVEDLLTRHSETTTVKSKATEQFYMRWWINRLKGLRLNHVTPALIEDAQRDLLAEQYAPQTVVHYLKALRHVLNNAVRDEKLDRNPFDRVRLVKVHNCKTRFLSPEEETRLLERLGPIYAPWARLAILTGMRLGEQFRLRWADVDLERGIITLLKTKAGKVQHVRLNAEARDILSQLDEAATKTHALQEAEAIANKRTEKPKRSLWVFPSENPDTHVDQRNFYSRTYRPAAVAAGLARPDLENYDEDDEEDVTWHTLRHTFASRLAMSGQPEGTIAALTRHSTTALVRRYMHLSPSYLHAAVEMVAEFGKPNPKTNQFQGGTVTETGKTEERQDEKPLEVIESIGAGGGI